MPAITTSPVSPRIDPLARRRSEQPALHCPRCGQIVRLRASWMPADFCPRCSTYARQTVRLVPLHPPRRD
jgi:uncharacterized C2H2 Zn-finger protein